MTNLRTPSEAERKREERERKRAERAAKREEQERYGLTTATKVFITGIIVLFLLLAGGAITYLAIALNQSRNDIRSANIASTEWSRRYVSLYDQYQNETGKKPTSLSPSAVQYLINTESGAAHTSDSPIPGVDLSGAGNPADGTDPTPPKWSYTINIQGHITKITCEPASNYDPSSPEFVCK